MSRVIDIVLENHKVRVSSVEPATSGKLEGYGFFRLSAQLAVEVCVKFIRLQEPYPSSFLVFSYRESHKEEGFLRRINLCRLSQYLRAEPKETLLLVAFLVYLYMLSIEPGVLWKLG